VSAFTVYECRNCLEHIRVTLAQSGYPLRCPVCGRAEWRVLVPPAVEDEHA